MVMYWAAGWWKDRLLLLPSPGKSLMISPIPGFKTCVLTNNWIDDTLWKGNMGLILSLLSRHFDLMIESCRVGLQKPDPKIYEYALRMLEAEPQEVRQKCPLLEMKDMIGAG